MDRLTEIRAIASKHNWVEIDHQENIYMVSFKRDRDRINVYYSKMTVTTCINHPIKGKTNLFRRNVYMNTLDKIFNYPRVHTGRGYYRRSEGRR